MHGVEQIRIDMDIDIDKFQVILKYIRTDWAVMKVLVHHTITAE